MEQQNGSVLTDFLLEARVIHTKRVLT